MLQGSVLLRRTVFPHHLVAAAKTANAAFAFGSSGGGEHARGRAEGLGETGDRGWCGASSGGMLTCMRHGQH